MFTEYSASLCNSHNMIMYWVKDIKKHLKKGVKEGSFDPVKLEGVFQVLDSIMVETRLAKRKGQRMEARLKAYYNSIIALGFKRIHK